MLIVMGLSQHPVHATQIQNTVKKRLNSTSVGWVHHHTLWVTILLMQQWNFCI